MACIPKNCFACAWRRRGSWPRSRTHPNGRPSSPPYRHDRLRESFEPVIAALRASLSTVLEQRAIPIPIEAKKFGISVATVADRGLYSTAVFVLAARADMPAEELRRRFPAQLKIGPVERSATRAACSFRECRCTRCPWRRGRSRFTRDSCISSSIKSNELWEQLKASGGVALHVAGEFPGLTLEFWAIRS